MKRQHNIVRIGILLRSFDLLQNWELRIIDQLQRDPTLQLCIVIKDGRTEKDIRKKGGRWYTRFKRLLLKKQIDFESRWYDYRYTVDRQGILNFLDGLPSITLFPKQKGFLDIFSKQDAALVASYNLDLILRHGFRIIQGEILTSSKHGIWGFHHADNNLNRGLLAGFWEILLGHSVIGTTLQVLTPELDGGLIIDKSFYTNSRSFVQNRRHITEQSVNLLFKNISKLQEGKLNLQMSRTYSKPLYTMPGLWDIFHYIVIFYSFLFRQYISKLCRQRTRSWTLFVGKGEFLESSLFRLKPQTVPKDHFWADPFLYRHEGNYFVFFENYSYQKKKACISCGRITGMQITDIIDVLTLKHHVSYPQVFEEDGNIYMLPETYKNSRLELYICKNFPDKWELQSTAFEGEAILDATYYRDEAGERWLFVNKAINENQNNELYIYRIDSLLMNNLEGHRQNPVLIDCRRARNAGSIFKYKGMTMRPSQNYSYGIYGYGLNVGCIEQLDIHEYQERSYVQVEPHFINGLKATHHLHQLDNLFVIDGSFSLNWY